MSASFRVNAPDVTFECFDTEVLVINLRSGSYYSLRESAVAMWQLLAAGQPVETVTARLVQSTGAAAGSVEVEVRRLLGELTQEGLLVAADAAAGAEPAVTLPATFVAPVFDRYTDMQQLLLIDPIHDVDASGWPVKPPETKA